MTLHHVYGSDPFAYDFTAALAAAHPTEREKRRVPGSVVPTRAELVRHARHFGIEGVNEVARAYGVNMTVSAGRNTGTPKTKAQLLRGLERAERIVGEVTATMPNKEVVARVDEALSALEGRKRLPSHLTVALVVALDGTGMVYRAIADKVEVSDATVRRILSERVEDTPISAKRAA